MLHSLPVLPPPWSSPINPCLDRREQRIAYRKLLLEHDPHCTYCGCYISRKKRSATIDHVIPRCRGGTNHPSNLVLCCRGCNDVKGELLPHEWLAALLRGCRRIAFDRRRAGEFSAQRVFGRKVRPLSGAALSR